MAEHTTSVSKGCFVIKKSVSSSPRKRPAVADFFPEVDGESAAQRKLRYANYMVCWNSIREEIEKLQSKMNSKIFSDLLNYIKKASRQNSAANDKTAVIQEIPTAALVTGVNMPDHDVVFSQLATELKQQVTPFVAMLRSKDCTVMKATMKSVILQFLGCDAQDEEDSVAEQSTKKISTFTLPVLSHWYKKKTKQAVTPSKNRRSSQISQFTAQPPLVIIFEDFEGFPPTIVQDFVMICSEYVSDLPLVLIFGVATAITAIHKVLPHSVSSVLSIERFQSQLSHTCLTEIICKVLMTPKFYFKLGARVFRLLYDNFLLHDFSLQNFARGLQFCIMEHFYENPLSIMCCVLPEERKDVLDKMNHKQVEMCRKKMSFRRYVEDAPPTRQPLLLLDDSFTKDVIAQMLNDLNRYHYCFFPVLKCLHLLTRNLPRHPLGKKLPDIYEQSLSSNIFQREEYDDAMSLLRVCSRDELESLLKACVDVLGDVLESPDWQSYCQELEETKDAITELIDQFDRLDELPETQTPSATQVEPTSKYPSRFELQERLMNAAKQKRKESPYDKLRQKTVVALDQIFRRFLICPCEMPLNEVIYFDNVLEIRQHLVGMPRLAIQTALSNPQYYLKCDCCHIDIGTVQDTLPDICIVYKLHLECGRLINLYDWLQAFIAVLEPQGDKTSSKGSPKKKKKMDDQLQARFIRAVSELQFLGFIKSTRQKTDHVQRLTWGVC